MESDPNDAAGEPLEDGRQDEQQAKAAAKAGQGAGHELRGQVRRQGRQQVEAKGQDARHEADVLIDLLASTARPDGEREREREREREPRVLPLEANLVIFSGVFFGLRGLLMLLLSRFASKHPLFQFGLATYVVSGTGRSVCRQVHERQSWVVSCCRLPRRGIIF